MAQLNPMLEELQQQILQHNRNAEAINPLGVKSYFL